MFWEGSHGGVPGVKIIPTPSKIIFHPSGASLWCVWESPARLAKYAVDRSPSWKLATVTDADQSSHRYEDGLKLLLSSVRCRPGPGQDLELQHVYVTSEIKPIINIAYWNT